MRLTVLDSGSAGNGYLLEGRRSALLLECGVRPEELFRMTDCPVSKIAGALVSHEHGDHAKYIDRYAALGIHIYGSVETLNQYAPFHAAAVIRPVRPMQRFSVGEFEVGAFDTIHDAAGPLGFIIQHRECGRILFLTDTAYCKYNFRDMALDHIMVEANYEDGILTANTASGRVEPSRALRTRQTHMSLRQACDLVRANQTAELKTVVLLHLSRDNADAASFARRMEETALFARIAVATRGTIIELKRDEINTVL